LTTPRTQGFASRCVASFALALACLAGNVAGAQVAIPRLEQRVTDLTGTLTAGQQAELEQRLAAFERRKGAQIVVLILPTTEPEDIAQFGIRLADAWKIGDAKSDAGAILIVAKNDRALRVEVGDGLEGALTDATAGRIINDTIVPLFKQGDYYAGVSAGVDRMLRVVDGEPLPPPVRAWDKRGGSLEKLPVLLIVLSIIGKVLRTFMGRAGAAFVGGGLGFGIAWIMTGSLLLAGITGVATLVLIVWLTAGSVGSWTLGGGEDSRRNRRWRDDDWGGGSSGGWGGGFSGGGGHFSGGGASGKW
jgi:uncharacterized protein